ncbi:MAG: metalloregulator ArsR/SmtB family transcription factor [Chloroflexota bacterium]|nr:metalloregulator ArsR/SmtB family transcription factor [Chloroflexota bacterium]
MNIMTAPAADPKLKLELTAKLFRGFADPSRLALLALLRDGERCVSELVEASGLTQSNVSSHLTCLRDCGLVTSRQAGRFVYYALAETGVEAMLGSADAILSRHANQIAACVNEHMLPGRAGNGGTR